jgi:ribosomal protein S1
VSTGQRIKVRVQEVDVGRKRISLSAKQENSARPAGKAKKAPKPTKQRALFATSPFADL